MRSAVRLMALSKLLALSAGARTEVQAHVRKHNFPAAVAQRMRIILALADGSTYREIAESLGTSAPTISLWKRRYEQDGIVRPATIRPGQPPSKLTAGLRARELAKTQQSPPDGSTHWSLPKMAAYVGVGKELVRKVWKEADLKPHLLERYMASNDPAFEQKAAEIIGLYLNPPQHRRYSALTRKARSRRWTA
jgi:transposase